MRTQEVHLAEVVTDAATPKVTRAGAPPRTATKWEPSGTLLRLHVGLEHSDDLIADLDAGFARLKGAS